MPFVAKLSLLIALSVLAWAPLIGQTPLSPRYNSPYSRFGLGDLSPVGYATQLGMGGVSLAYADAHIANPVNPASLGALRFATYQVGLGLGRDVVTSGAQTNSAYSGNLQYLSLAFTTRNTLNDLLDARVRKTRYAALFSVSPYSSQGYNIELSRDQGEVGNVVNAFTGTGGFYRLRSGHALEIGKFLRVGVNVGYIFGRTNTQVRVQTGDLPGASRIVDTESLRARGLELVFGSQYDLVLARQDERPTRVLTLGATATLNGDLQGSGRRLITRQSGFNPNDTLSFAESGGQRIKQPNAIGAGFIYRKVNQWSVGADLAYTTWNSYRNSLRPDERLKSGMQVNVGGEWIPEYQTFNKYHLTVRYRLGAYFQQDPRPGVDADRGVTLGFGLPIVRAREELSYVNLALNAGALATPGPLDQRYVRLTIGFNLTDNTWFYKRRFN